jgi:hypothetical protein
VVVWARGADAAAADVDRGNGGATAGNGGAVAAELPVAAARSPNRVVAAAGTSAGTVIGSPHAGHLSVFPAELRSTVICSWQF